MHSVICVLHLQRAVLVNLLAPWDRWVTWGQSVGWMVPWCPGTTPSYPLHVGIESWGLSTASCGPPHKRIWPWSWVPPSVRGPRDLAAGKRCHHTPANKLPDPWGNLQARCHRAVGWIRPMGQGLSTPNIGHWWSTQDVPWITHLC